MQTTPVKLLDAVALLQDKPSEGLEAGCVGTVVEILSANAFGVEFLNTERRTVALCELAREELLVRKHEVAA